jgi:hypothetical protein
LENVSKMGTCILQDYDDITHSYTQALDMLNKYNFDLSSGQYAAVI